MNTKKLGIVAACALLGVIALWLTVFRPSEEDRIRKTLGRITKAVAVKSDDNPLARMGRLKSELKETTTDDVFVTVPDFDVRVTNRTTLVEAASKAPAVYSSADVELTGLTIKVDDAATTAKADAIAVVTGERGGERKIDKRDVHFLLRKDGEWKVTTIDVAAPRP